MKAPYIWLLVLDALLFSGGVTAERWADVGALPLTLALGLIAIVTFLGLLSAMGAATGDDIRAATAVAVVVTYLALVAMIAFTDASSEESPVLTHFTTLVGVVFAFYFGGSAAMKIAAIRHNRAAPKD